MTTPSNLDGGVMKDAAATSDSSPTASKSPANTIRRVTPSTQTALETVEERRGSEVESPMMYDAASSSDQRGREYQSDLQGLGMGRPRDSRDALTRPPPFHPETSPATSLPFARKAVSPGRSASIMSSEDDYTESQASSYRPQSTFLRPMDPGQTGDQTPRVGAGGSVRGPGQPPQSATGSAIESPNLVPGGTGTSRPRIGRGNTTTAHPVSHPISGNVVGSMSRSASKARAPPPSAISLGMGIGPRDRSANPDDEDEDEDRGQALIRQRQQERKRARRAKEKERERGRKLAEDGMATDTSAPPTGVPDESFSTQQARLMGQGPSRSASRARTPSATGDKRVTSEGYFGLGSGGDTAGEVRSPVDERRPPSIYSTIGDEEEEEMPPDDRSVVDDVVQEVLNEETGPGSEEEDEGDASGEGDEGVTLKDRQDALNIEHPFGLPIWKPALYRKSRSVTRNAESALHSIPSAAAERHLLPGNLLWVVLFGWWLSIVCLVVAVLVSGAEVLGGGRGGYGKTLRGLAWYIGWPFGKYVEGEGGPEDDETQSSDDQAEENGHADYGTWNDGSPTRHDKNRKVSDGASSGVTVRDTQYEPMPPSASSESDLPDEPVSSAESGTSEPSGSRPDHEPRQPTVTFAANVKGKARGSYALHGLSQEEMEETAPLLMKKPGPTPFRRPRNQRAKMLGRIVYWPAFFLIVAPLMFLVCVLCWGMIFSIPMAKLNWALIKLLYLRPQEINFNSAPKVAVFDKDSPSMNRDANQSGETTLAGSGNGSGSEGSPNGQPYKIQSARLTAGQVAPTPGYKSTVLLCTYRAVGLQYYKYTVGGVNIIFINLLPLVFFTIIDAFLLLPAAERAEHRGHILHPFIAFVTSQALIFVLSLASVIPLSYFIGMAVASISAQSSIGMGAVINATFGSIIEIILYAIALTQGKGRLVEGSIIGSILAGVLLMPGASMCSGALVKKEQKFNAKSAGVTSTMLIMAIIGTLTPTMFYQTYGSFELHCSGCPEPIGATGPSFSADEAWRCDNCYYEHPDPAGDPFYQDQVKTLMYACAAILLFSYIIGLWFSLRTHAAQIYQNPQQIMRSEEHAALPPAIRSSLGQRVTPQAVMQHILPLYKAQPGQGLSTPNAASSPMMPSGQGSLRHLPPKTAALMTSQSMMPPGSPLSQKNDQALTTPSKSDAGPGRLVAPTGSQPHSRMSSGNYTLPGGYSPFLETVDRDIKNNHLTPMRLPSSLTTEDFTRAVAVATVSALRHQGSIVGNQLGSATKRDRSAGGGVVTGGAITGQKEEEDEGHGGHEAPEWTRGISAGVLLGCTLLYALIAEILVDVVDVVLHGSGIDEKFLGLTLFALVPNTTEFMNAMSFAMNGNIALSMEIGSAYALQVCLLQIPAMVAFSAIYDPAKLGEVVDTFTLIFPRWDVIAIILSIFLLTYTYIEARSNYHRGSILMLAYVVLVMGFYYAPPRRSEDNLDALHDGMVFPAAEAVKMGFMTSISKIWG